MREALRLSFFNRYGQLAIQMIATVILSRILTPEDIGVFSVTIAMVGFAHVLRDFGAGEYVIQEKELTSSRIRAAAGLTTLLAWVLAILMFVGAGAIARFYKHPGIEDILYVFTICFALIPFGAITMAYFRREMQFDKLMRVQLTSALVQPVISIICAFQGMGYMSLAWGSLGGVITTVAMTFLMRPVAVAYFPGFREMSRVFSYGSWSSGNALLIHAGKSAPEMILGKLADMQSVGFFSRALGAVDLFDRLVSLAIKPVLLPYFSKEAREQGGIKGVYLYALDCYLGLAWPFFIVMAVLAFPLIRILYGAQWDVAVPLAQALCIGAVISALTGLAGDALKASGQVKDVTQVSAVMAAVRVVAVIAAAPFGLVAVAISLSMTSLVHVVLIYRQLDRYHGISAADYLPVILRSGGVAVFAAMVPVAALIYFGQSVQTVWPLGILGAVGACVGGLLGVRVFRHPIQQELRKLMARDRNRES